VKHAALVALVLSIGLNAWLILRVLSEARAGAPAGTARASGPRNAGPSPRASTSPLLDASPAPEVGNDAGLDALRARIAELEQRRSELRARLAAFAGADPVFLIVHGSVGLAEKLRAIGKLTEEDQEAALQELAEDADRDEMKAEMLGLLAQEQDEGALHALGRLLQFMRSAMHMERFGLEGEEWREVLRVMQEGQTADRRYAAAQIMADGDSDDDGYDKLRNRVIAMALRIESDPRIVEVLVRDVGFYGDQLPDPDVVAALRVAADRLPAGDLRVSAFASLARASLLVDGGQEIFDRSRRAFDPALRADYAAALGKCVQRTAPDLSEEVRAERRSLLREIYAQSPDESVRRSLVIASARGLGLVAATGPQTVEFLRGLTLIEPDAAMKERLSELADQVETGFPLDSWAVERILRGRE